MGLSLRALAESHYQIVLVLLGAAIVSASMGVYTNWDAETEFSAAVSVVTQGFPYVASGLMIDQAPLTFYLTAPWLELFGASYAVGVGFIAVLGLGCVAVIYVLGLVLYGKRTGLVAAALLGLVPWHVFMSRAYLIDTPYLFLSLIFMVFGVLAIKRNSTGMLAGSGVFFALALLTKPFCVFLMLPLLLLAAWKGKDTGFKLTPKRVLIFLAPSLLLHAVWYGGFANQNFLGVYFHPDFQNSNQMLTPALDFVPRIYVESAGWFLLAAAAFALVMAVVFRRLLAKTLYVDAALAITVGAVAALDLAMVLALHMLVPYVSAFKYLYATVPLLCLLAASTADKSKLLLASTLKPKVKWLLVLAGLTLVLASMFESVMFLNHTEPYELADFKVDFVGHYFPFYVYSPVSSNFALLHYLALGVILAGLLLPLIFQLSGRFSFRKQKNYA